MCHSCCDKFTSLAGSILFFKDKVLFTKLFLNPSRRMVHSCGDLPPKTGSKFSNKLNHPKSTRRRIVVRQKSINQTIHDDLSIPTFINKNHRFTTEYLVRHKHTHTQITLYKSWLTQDPDDVRRSSGFSI